MDMRFIPIENRRRKQKRVNDYSFNNKMVKQEFNLSEKIQSLVFDDGRLLNYIELSNVEEFIKKLKEELFEEAIERNLPLTASSLDSVPLNWINRKIKNITGDKFF